MRFDYLEFLLKEARLSQPFLEIRGVFIRDEDSHKILINTLFESGLTPYVRPLVDREIVPYERGIDSSLDIVEVDVELRKYINFLSRVELRSIFRAHHHPAFRVGAFVANYLMLADKEFSKE